MALSSFFFDLPRFNSSSAVVDDAFGLARFVVDVEVDIEGVLGLAGLVVVFVEVVVVLTGVDVGVATGGVVVVVWGSTRNSSGCL